MNAPGQWIFYVTNTDFITEPDLYEHSKLGLGYVVILVMKRN